MSNNINLQLNNALNMSTTLGEMKMLLEVVQKDDKLPYLKDAFDIDTAINGFVKYFSKQIDGEYFSVWRKLYATLLDKTMQISTRKHLLYVVVMQQLNECLHNVYNKQNETFDKLGNLVLCKQFLMGNREFVNLSITDSPVFVAKKDEKFADLLEINVSQKVFTLFQNVDVALLPDSYNFCFDGVETFYKNVFYDHQEICYANKQLFEILVLGMKSQGFKQLSAQID